MDNIYKILWGVVLICLGIIIGTNSFGITDINIFFKGWWTLFIIIPCLIDLFREKTNKKANIIGIVIGVILLLTTNEVIKFEILVKLIIPIAFVGVGLYLVFGDTLKKERKTNSNKRGKNETNNRNKKIN